MLDSKIIQTWDDKREAGTRFRIKNNSTENVNELAITVYYNDKNGKAFFEQTFYPVSNSAFSSTGVLKPNYSVLYPAESDHYMTASGIDLDQWDEGNVKVEITKVGFQD